MLSRLSSFVSTPKDSSPSLALAVEPVEDPLASLSSSLLSALPAPSRRALPIPSQLDDLKAQLPIACSSCDACEEDEEEDGQFPELPSKFDMDLETPMLGDIIKPMNRLVIIATSKTDWIHEIAEEPASLAFHLSLVEKRKVVRASPEGNDKETPGLYDTQEMSKLAVLASSIEVDAEDGRTSTLLFPDFKYISSVSISQEGAQAFYDQALDPSVGPLAHAASSSADQLESWILPYRAVVLLCSHKTRDKKCGIAAPLLESVLTSALTLHNIDVDTTGSSLHHLPASEKISRLLSDEDVQKLLHNVAGTGKGGGGGSKEVGIFRISHLSGHKYSGVMIICFPSGAILYYGRVRPRDCVAIVEKTILKGEILAEHLRGGGNLKRQKGKSLLDW